MYTFRDIPAEILKHEILTYFCKRVDITAEFSDSTYPNMQSFIIKYSCDGFKLSILFDVLQSGIYILGDITWRSSIVEKFYDINHKCYTNRTINSFLRGGGIGGYDISSSSSVCRSVQDFMVGLYDSCKRRDFSYSETYSVVTYPMLRELTEINDQIKILVMDIPLPDGYLNQIFNQI